MTARPFRVPVWAAVAFVLILLGGGVFMLSVAWQARDAARGVSGDVLDTRVATCRNAAALGVALDADGPCYRPEVLARYDPDRVRNLIPCRTALEVRGTRDGLSDACLKVLDANVRG